MHVECGTDIVAMLHRNHRRRGDNKARKLKSTLPTYGPTNGSGIATKEQLLNSKHAFSGRKDGSILTAPKDWVIYPFDRYEVVSRAGEGGICYNGGELVFAIASRENIDTRFSKVGNVYDSLEAITNGKGKSISRGTKREVMSDAGAPLYRTLGATARRNAHGVYVKKPPECSERSWNTIGSLSKVVHHVAESITPTKLLRGIQKATNVIPPVGNSHRIWNSVAFGKNIFLNSHTDEDSFLSVTTVITHPMNGSHYEKDDPIVQYFVFPEVGFAVALRPGDVLVFNPLYFHSVSSRTEEGEKQDTYCLSFYLKTAVVGGNDNSLPLSQFQIKVATELGVN